MKKLRISTSCNLHCYPKDDINEYFRQGLVFHKKASFEALDCPISLITASESDWKRHVETLIRDAEAAGIAFELCHLPFGVTHKSSA